MHIVYVENLKMINLEICTYLYLNHIKNTIMYVLLHIYIKNYTLRDTRNKISKKMHCIIIRVYQTAHILEIILPQLAF